MTCKNCNNNLTGTEDYCPFCGTPQKFADLKISSAEEKESAQTKSAENSIFQSEPVYIYTEAPQKKKDPKTKIAVTLVSLFLITLFCIGSLSLVRYFNLTPAFSAFFATMQAETQTTLQAEITTESNFDNTIGLVSPDITFKATLCTVISEQGLPIRKGPDNAFAQIDYISNGTVLQVIGKSLQNNLWVYAYIPSLDVYGWISGSYISQNSALIEPTSAEYTETENHKN